MYISVLFIYSLQIFGYDSLWYNCSIVIIFYFPCFILLFVLVICAFFHTCMFLMELSLSIKNLNMNLNLTIHLMQNVLAFKPDVEQQRIRWLTQKRGHN